MMNRQQIDEQARFRRQQTELAIQLAMQSKWQEAIDVNRTLVAEVGGDPETYNRLGKACTETGQFEEAREAYSNALKLDPTNNIARKNLDRLANVGAAATQQGVVATKVDPRLFIEETGKTAHTTLVDVPGPEVLARVTAGDQVDLRVNGRSVLVVTPQGEVIGSLDTKLGLRLIGLIAGGNRYTAAVTGVDEHNVRIILRETYQHPDQIGKVSFPTNLGPEMGFRPYIKESVFRYMLEDEDEDHFDEGDEYRADGEHEAEEPEHPLFDDDARGVDG